MNRQATFSRMVCFFCAGIWVLLSAACGGQSSGPVPLADPLYASTAQALAYGITIPVPQGWSILSATRPKDPADEQIRLVLKKGEDVLLLHMLHKDAKGVTNAEAGVIALSSAMYFLNEQTARTATQQDLDALAARQLERERNERKKGQPYNETLELLMRQSTVAGHPCIVHSILGRGGDGNMMRIMLYNIYLPNNIGVQCYFKMRPENTQLTEQVEAVMRSLTVQP